ncbi:MAG: 1-(5-phosphoribosyl)-5-[(5-phosphoribosylamino)methylideneamino]imidazole-4-carboxamide isomerase [Candidatus Levybacteria bacterium RIFCSPHIGHO2_12_FULL_38_12]|nr:MAG: 1-(5-phosphoribosyl)-5-[(5-phosphoribosylamino)methylideneamino]imidazole-4-carboxamide isomerase [Candidatus Levybacteria bacterium RIFCSPHIGHO2_01_FULL_38_12]OGH22099.1 MAG: 1-(5-phosphoribosyl)-5-[(5-phosphoribosylamino)methylideneamino]imidazole-4-carboxamide isomerase [Candidatus Levybacteria bacterium RIFCSPHIGHO2_02_FULL_37_18]OGH22947.1 MAG: 1-(5-phosphoribosyl)-5-[(5-phosphoribosylamino)methylideneamino]imidazole-4-carboxamide isomerase [Candidatus Levybacteria bacterium RIFCSPHI
MLVIPAIDIKNGQCVRLTQGDFTKEKIYEQDPVAMAKKFEQNGPDLIHIVDLDGAKDGLMKNKKVIEQISKTIQVPIELGGGIRDKKTIDGLLSFVDRIILGTAAIENKEFLKEAITKYGDRIAVSLDAKDGKLTTRGWVETTDQDVFDYAKELESIGIQTIIYTDIARDGTLTSPNFSSIERLRSYISCFLIASGGVSSLEDIKKLKELGVDGVIIGKALYEGKVDLKETIAICHPELVFTESDSVSGSVMKGDAELRIQHDTVYAG